MAASMNFYFYCPYCKCPTGSTTSTFLYGSPLHVCPECGKTYINAHYTEPALKPYRPQSIPTLLLASLPYALGFAALTGLIATLPVKSFSAFLIAAGITFPVCWAVVFLYLLLSRKRYEKKRVAEWNASDQRLRRPEYASLLGTFGYNVPARYLPQDFKHEHESFPYKPALIHKPGDLCKRPETKPPSLNTKFF